MAERGPDRRLALASAWFFCLLFAWYTVRPVRESLATTTPESSLKWVMAATFGTMFLAAPLYAGLAATLRRRTLYIVLFAGFAIVFASFARQFHTMPPSPWVTGLFYVWASFFSLFSVSCFWSFAVDVFTSEEGKLMFGRITAAGSLGGILASTVATFIAPRIGTSGLILLSSTTLALAGFFSVLFDRAALRYGSSADAGRERRPDIRPWDVFLTLVRSPFLQTLAGFLFLSSIIDTVLYLDMNRLMRGIADVNLRTQYFAGWNLASQVLTIACQALATPWVLTHWGVRPALVGVPIVYAATFLGLSIWNAIPLALVTTLIIRVLYLGLIAPAREVLFARVSREEKYSAKNLIDTVAVRGGSVIAPFSVDAALAAGGVMTTVLLGTAPIALVIAGLGWALSRQAPTAQEPRAH